MPKNIITYQDFAMRNAIYEVFIGILHKHCRWHIMKKALEKLGRLMVDDQPLNKAFKDYVDNNLSGNVFPHNTLHSHNRKLAIVLQYPKLPC